MGDCVSIEFGHGLDAFEGCHQFILTFFLNHCLQGTEEMAWEEGSGQGAKHLLANEVGSPHNNHTTHLYIRPASQLSGSKQKWGAFNN